MVIHQSACAAVRITVRIFIERLKRTAYSATRSSRESGRSVDAPNNSLDQTSLRSRLKPTLSVCFHRFGIAALRNPERPLRVDSSRYRSGGDRLLTVCCGRPFGVDQRQLMAELSRSSEVRSTWTKAKAPRVVAANGAPGFPRVPSTSRRKVKQPEEWCRAYAGRSLHLLHARSPHFVPDDR